MLALIVRARMALMTPDAETITVATDMTGGQAGVLVPAAQRRAGLDEDMRWAVPFAIAMLAAVAVFVEQIATKTAVFQ